MSNYSNKYKGIIGSNNGLWWQCSVVRAAHMANPTIIAPVPLGKHAKPCAPAMIRQLTVSPRAQLGLQTKIKTTHCKYLPIKKRHRAGNECNGTRVQCARVDTLSMHVVIICICILSFSVANYFSSSCAIEISTDWSEISRHIEVPSGERYGDRSWAPGRIIIVVGRWFHPSRWDRVTRVEGREAETGQQPKPVACSVVIVSDYKLPKYFTTRVDTPTER